MPTDEWTAKRAASLWKEAASAGNRLEQVAVMDAALTDAIARTREEQNADIERLRAERDEVQAELDKFDCRLQDAVDHALSIHEHRTQARNDGYEYGTRAERERIKAMLKQPSEEMVEAIADFQFDRDERGAPIVTVFSLQHFLRAIADTLEETDG